MGDELIDHSWIVRSGPDGIHGLVVTGGGPRRGRGGYQAQQWMLVCGVVVPMPELLLCTRPDYRWEEAPAGVLLQPGPSS